MAQPDIVTLTVSRYTCLRCGYTWIGRDPGVVPKRCAACTSPYWNRPRQHPVAVPATLEPAQVGTAAMPLFGGQWQWPLELAWSFYRLSPQAHKRLEDAGMKAQRRHPGGVFAVWHPLIPTPPPELLLVETTAPRGWWDPEDPEKPGVLPSLRRLDEARFRGERPWTRWRRPQAARHATP